MENEPAQTQPVPETGSNVKPLFSDEAVSRPKPEAPTSQPRESTTPIPFHPVADIFPLMTGQPFEDLKADIKEYGLREPIWLYENQIIDGRNRYNACQELGVPIRTREWDGQGDLVAFVVSLNLHRRHLDESQRGMVAAKIANMPHGGERRGENFKECINSLKQPTLQQTADMLNVGRDTVVKAKKVIRDGVSELVSAVDSGDIKVRSAADIATLPEGEQRTVVAGGPKAVKEAAKKIRAGKKAPQTQVTPGDDEEINKVTGRTNAQEQEFQEKLKLVSPEFLNASKALAKIIKAEKKEGWIKTSREATLSRLNDLLFLAAKK